MKPRLILAYLIAIILLMGSQFSIVSGHIDKVGFDKKTYEPGEQGKCTIIFSDPFGDTPVNITKVELKFDFGTTTWTGDLYIEPRETKTLEIVFTIPEDTDEGDYRFSVYFEFYKKEGKRWRWVPPGGYGPTGETISVRKPFQIPGYPLVSIILGLSIGVSMLLHSCRKKPIPLRK